MSAKKDFLDEASKVKRPGMKELVAYLETTDFFECPASTQFHGCQELGLVIHSLTVFDIMKDLNETLECGMEKESIAICALLHDVCKANYYVKEIRNKKENGKWHEVEVWGVKDQFPMGHGEKSVYIINRYMVLKDAEALAIRWHLNGFDPGVHFNYPSGYSQKQAMRSNKLIPLLATADMAASYLIDTW
jgi:hypothetical protein